jgi:hypothetical protein|tara:strand:- start:290 stop:730 length:441 start_codon:yes stop_codon:yes gene_type:complete
MRKSIKREKVWKYLLKNKTATAKQVAKACGVSYGYARNMMNSIGTPKEVFIEEAKPPLRCQLLNEAVSLTATDRNKDYGDAVENHEHIARIYNAITGQHLTARDITLVHQATKLARRQTSPLKKDHYVDNMAYVGIEYECVLKEGK